jgi:hypothetical protein
MALVFCAIAAAQYVRTAFFWCRGILSDMPRLRGNPRLGLAILVLLGTWFSLLAASGFFTYALPKAIGRMLTSP